MQPIHGTQQSIMEALKEDAARTAWFRGQSISSAPWLNVAMFGGHHWSYMSIEAYHSNIRLRLLLAPITMVRSFAPSSLEMA